ncbi:hypothetical protein [Maribacter sp. Hel_I_7]|uniref:hypothetical protein n=1 Tax=Maribacter sp. Hel_I_7 TaxID=1249997 RepID=UPI0004799DDA|nr:hypothetical protein [Maribacter sp. Hel_I_7]
MKAQEFYQKSDLDIDTRKEIFAFAEAYHAKKLILHSNVKSSCDKVDLSLVLSEHHKYILENNYTQNYIDTDLVAFEFMGMDYDEQEISKN